MAQTLNITKLVQNGSNDQVLTFAVRHELSYSHMDAVQALQRRQSDNWGASQVFASDDDAVVEYRWNLSRALGEAAIDPVGKLPNCAL